jgi:predicted transposase YbfD/YdcC
MVSAWATANQISLGQVIVDEKSNEITAIPKLLNLLEISGCLVTIDAMGCQTAIAQAILDAGADYVLAVKDNQPTLHDGLSWFFLTQRETDFARTKVSRHQTRGKGHGREETRTSYVCDVPRELPDRERWPGLKAIGWVISDTLRDGKRCHEIRRGRRTSSPRRWTRPESRWGRCDRKRTGLAAPSAAGMCRAPSRISPRSRRPWGPSST